MDIRYKVPNSYMMVKSRLNTLLNNLQSMKLLIQISICLLESSTSCILVLRYKSCGQRSRARPSCVRKLTATGNCKVEILGYLAVLSGFLKMRFILEIVLLDPCMNWALVSILQSMPVGAQTGWIRAISVDVHYSDQLCWSFVGIEDL